MKSPVKLLLCALVLITTLKGNSQPNNFYENFAWDFHNGKNFITPPRDQIIQGPCHIFAALAQVESLFELLYFQPGYFNGWYNLYLSPFWVNSVCTEKGKWSKIYPYLQSDGVIEECTGWDWHPDYINNMDPSLCGTSPCTNKYKISWHPIHLENLTNKNIQDSIYKNGPIQLMLYKTFYTELGTHALLLYGWKKKNNKLYWIFKDSFRGHPSNDLELAMDSLDIPQNFIDWTYLEAKVITGVDLLVNGVVTNPSRGYTDGDQDGYYFWGVGPKPSGCPGGNQQDFADGDPSKGPMQIDGYAKPIPNNLTAPVGQMLIYGPPQFGNCNASHTINSSYWKNNTSDMMDWTPFYGSTPTANTGPDYSAPGAQGLYLYLEATGGCYNTNAVLESKYYFYLPSNNFSLKYYYHMHGSSMGSLKVMVQRYPSSTWDILSTKSGEQGPNWNSQTISLSNYSGSSIKIRFEGITGYGEYSDMAIQNISIITSGSGKKGLANPQETDTLDKAKNTTIINNSSNSSNSRKAEAVFTIFPNPASTQLNISTSEMFNYTFIIFDLSGRVILNKELNSSQKIDIGNIPNGIYLIQIQYGEKVEKTFSQQLIINK